MHTACLSAGGAWRSDMVLMSLTMAALLISMPAAPCHLRVQSSGCSPGVLIVQTALRQPSLQLQTVLRNPCGPCGMLAGALPSWTSTGQREGTLCRTKSHAGHQNNQVLACTVSWAHSFTMWLRYSSQYASSAASWGVP